MADTPNQVFPARVVHVVDPFRVAINRGAANGIQKGQRFLIYSLGKELFDPDSGESLGQLEIVHGTGVVSHVQDKIATISSDMRAPSRKKKVVRNSPYASFLGQSEEIVEEGGSTEPFDQPSVGDHAKPI